MLPGDVLSKHGYTRKWGFFSGVCVGAHQKPFEVSKDAIAGAVAAVEKTIAEFDAQIAELENIDSEINSKTEAWNHTYKQSGMYVWEKVPVLDFGSNVYGTSTNYHAFITVTNYRSKEPRKERIEAYDKAWHMPTFRHWVHFLNCGYAKHLRSVNSSRRQWVKWQQDRMANWAPKPLTPRAEKATVVA